MICDDFSMTPPHIKYISITNTSKHLFHICYAYFKYGIYMRLLSKEVQKLRNLEWTLFSKSYIDLYSGIQTRGWSTWWRHQMQIFSALLAICAGNSPVTGEFHAQRPVTQSFDVFFDLHLINSWVNNREAGDLRRHRVHYDVIVMVAVFCGLYSTDSYAASFSTISL